MKTSFLTVSPDGGSVTLNHEAICSIPPDEFHLYTVGEQNFLRLYREVGFIPVGPITSPDVNFKDVTHEEVCIMLIPIIMIEPELRKHMAA
ncbi:MAG: hypothetical protein V4686_01175 [Patescibacteria group bacterium]